MRIMRNSVIIVFIVTLISFSVVFFLQKTNEDDTVPEITIENDFIEVKCNASDADFLKGVKATDEKDGDLTDKVIVESISRFIEPGVCEVKYAVCDSNNHVAHATRKVCYTDYIAPRFKVTDSLCFSLYENVNISSYVGAVDCIEGDISGNVVITSPDYTSSVTGVFTLDLTVTNKKGDTSTLSLPLIMEERSLSAPKIELKEYLIYVDKNQNVNFKDYIVEATSKNGEDLTSNVRIDDNVEIQKSGTYIVNYFVTDRNGAEGHSVLNVVVE
ncbi:MAG: DUF5011 domain-containing protein [Clostridia bacterium]|nr:DUF5011 domain-containing protein [Clostridia bacterium]MBQ8766774.1 DUF5011 domain-containing protein [Clostridia bacterium]